MGDEEQQIEEQDEQQDGGAASARRQAHEVEEAKEQMHDLEEGDPPERLEDWPSGRAKYLTYGGPEGTAGYDEGPTRKLGPSSLQHHEDGSVTIEGEEVDNPEEYKGDPIPGGPTDPDAPDDPAGLEDKDSDDDDEDEDGPEASGADDDDTDDHD